MNIKKMAQLFVAVFITILVTDFVIHEIILKPIYLATQSLWRPESEMSSFMPFMFLGQAIIALFFSWIFLHGYKGKGPSEGVRYGLLLAGFMAGHNLVMYSVAPYGFGMIAGWIGFGALQAVITGVVCAMVCGKKKL